MRIIPWKRTPKTVADKATIGTQLWPPWALLFRSLPSPHISLHSNTSGSEITSPSRREVWVPHTRRVINHKHETGFCNRTGAKNPLAVIPSRLVCFSEEHLSEERVFLLCLWFASLLDQPRPLHCKYGMTKVLQKRLQGAVFRLSTGLEKSETS